MFVFCRVENINIFGCFKWINIHKRFIVMRKVLKLLISILSDTFITVVNQINIVDKQTQITPLSLFFSSYHEFANLYVYEIVEWNKSITNTLREQKRECRMNSKYTYKPFCRYRWKHFYRLEEFPFSHLLICRYWLKQF